MPEPVRVRDDITRHEYSTYAVDADGKSYEGLTVLDEPAVDALGALLPPKYPSAETTAAPKPQATPGPKATSKES